MDTESQELRMERSLTPLSAEKWTFPHPKSEAGDRDVLVTTKLLEALVSWPWPTRSELRSRRHTTAVCPLTKRQKLMKEWPKYHDRGKVKKTEDR